VTARPPEDAEHGVRLQAPDDDDPWVQVNVRMRRSMRDALDARRGLLGLTRDAWFRYVTEWALLQPLGTLVRMLPRGRRRART